MSNTDTLRPFSTSSIISPHAALEVLAQNTGESSTTSHSQSQSQSQYPSGSQAHTRSEMDEEIMNSDEDRATTPSDNRDGHQHQSATAGNNDLPPRYMVRAQFDFHASDPSALSFQAGDMIEVYTMLESGWWDGMLGDKRGWFPSNFVEEVDYDVGSEDQDQDQSQDPHGSSLGHDHGLVGDELDRERDMRMLESEDFGPPIRRGDSQQEASLGLEDVLAGGAGWGAGGGGLGDLAREMMAANLKDQAQEQEDDGKAFEAEALRRRRMRDSDDTGEFGTLVTPPHRRREETNDTIKARPNGQRQTTAGGDVVTGTGAGASNANIPAKGPGEVQDAWIPSLTPDGQVYYLNDHTGETSWEMPVSTPSAESEGGYYTHHRQSGDEGAYFNAYTSAPSSSAHLDRDAAGTDESFRLPPFVQGQIPYPWVSRMSDDGREWLYYNRITGQTRSDLPANGSGADAISTFDQSRARSRLSSRASSLPIRASVELQRRAVEDWEKKTRRALDNVLKQAARPSLALLVDHTQDALREVFEACVAGSAAEEEMSRAHDMGSESGVATAALREESARDMLAEAHTATMGTVRDLLGSFGYVGPLDKMEDLPRPTWSQDVTLVGSIGLLSSNVHAAVVSRIRPASGSSSWSEVLRAATRLKDIVTDLPDRLGTPDDTLGKQLSASLGISTFEILGGRWGFGPISEGLRLLDHETVVESQRLKAEFEVALSSSDVLWIVRNANRFQQLLSTIDIASVIDVDGEDGEGRARHEEVETYSHLVARARQHLFDLDAAYRSIAHASADMLTRPDAMSIHAAVDTSFRCLSTLLMVVKEQHAFLSQSPLRGSVGRRSAVYRARLRQRHQSITSQTSGTSRASRASRIVEVDELRRRAKTMEQEYAEEEQQGLEQLRDRDRRYQQQPSQIVRSATAPVTMPLTMGHSANPSASASQTSLRFGSSGGGGHRGQRSMSATSSSTSLAYKDTESDSGSQKGTNRSSFMRFMKGRNSEDDGGIRRTKPSKKLAKLLGEDSFAQIPINNLPPQPAPLIATPIPERPWYLGEDYDPSEIVFDDRGVVKAGTIKALIARLTPHGSTDTAFFQAFLLTFRSFTSGDDLLDLLMERYHIQPPPQLDDAELADWKKQKQTPIRLRVVNTIRSWLDTHYIEIQDAPILERVEKFAEDLQSEGSQTMSKQLQGLVARKRSAESDGPRRIISGGLLSPPAPLLPRVPSGRSIRLLDISPVELARQLTIIESLHFQRIKAIECLNKAWAREDGPKAAPNVRWVILTANRMAGWVALQILSSKDVKVRASIMKYFVQTAIELRNLNNFSSMAGVVAGLNSAPITRLKRTKELLSAKTASLKANLDATLDSSKNFANYKDMLKTINPPCVPFFGFYLSALTFIEDGNKDLVQPEGHAQPLINFFKRSLSADILRDIHQYQSQPYNLARCKPVYDYICSGLEVVEKSGDLYEMSLVLEPREREEERITRMLHDSGFL